MIMETVSAAGRTVALSNALSDAASEAGDIAALMSAIIDQLEEIENLTCPKGPWPNALVSERTNIAWRLAYIALTTSRRIVKESDRLATDLG